MNYSIFALKISSVYVWEYVSLCIQREKRLKSTQSISIFFWGLGLGSRIRFFSFLLLHALQNCLNLLLCDVYNFKKKKRKTKGRNLPKNFRWRKWISILCQHISFTSDSLGQQHSVISSTPKNHLTNFSPTWENLLFFFWHHLLRAFVCTWITV